MDGLIHFQSGGDQGELLDSSIQDMCQARCGAWGWEVRSSAEPRDRCCGSAVRASSAPSLADGVLCRRCRRALLLQGVNEILDAMVKKGLPVNV